MAKPLKAVLGARVRDLRRSRGLTQEGPAEQLAVTPRYLAGIERGERNLTLDSVDALADQLGVVALTLLDPSADPTRLR
ncbi:Helix-turn-helix domain-containing protein [Saccharopolyspora shandongensis]|uniref:Helix-turn-helix domain-containing protein n=1 Tax=Saccharopolyspora shandongensis TaxID=418495 RepID=A0A1H3S9C0_9PSEU|nr:helix-turn-helix transcriptional regulator [Saccharopolyspora shandongensis]SDZ34165.1 Helix-turn-helix domain-containing protein [Saccharopolyspora shandongensis]